MIETERLLLREMAEGDAAALMKVWGDDENMKHTNLSSQATARAYGCRFLGEYPDEPNEVTRVFGLSRAEREKKR